MRKRGIPARPVALAWLGLVAFAAAADRPTPPALAREHPDRAALLSLVEGLPAGACVQAAIPVSPQVPLALRVFPLLPPEGHPLRAPDPPFFRAEAFADCKGHFLLFDPGDPRPPYYIEEHLLRLAAYGETIAAPLQAGRWRLYRLD